MLDDLKKAVYEANYELESSGLIIETWGNISAITEDKKYLIIKPSGIKCKNMHPCDMSIVELCTGNVIEGNNKPSVDTPTHIEIYKAFENVGAIVHTHSINAVAFAQAGLVVPLLGTTQADTFDGDIPCTRSLKKNEVEIDYEKNVGKVIVETFETLNVDPQRIPGVLVKSHGPFTWGKDMSEALFNAKVLETICEMDMKTLLLKPEAEMTKYLASKHYSRKHGINSYYGQE